MNEHTSDTWGEMLEILRDIGDVYDRKSVKEPQTPLKHMERCWYCNGPIEEGVVKGGYTYCNLDHAIKQALKKAEGENGYNK